MLFITTVSEAAIEPMDWAVEPKNESKLAIIFHQNGITIVSARLIAPGSRLVDTGGELPGRFQTLGLTWHLLTRVCGFCEFATSVLVGFRPTLDKMMDSYQSGIGHFRRPLI